MQMLYDAQNGEAMIEMGRIDLTQTPDGWTYTWSGGDHIRISRDLMIHALPEVFTYETFPEKPGDRFMAGPYHLEVVECLPLDVFLAVKI